MTVMVENEMTEDFKVYLESRGRVEGTGWHVSTENELPCKFYKEIILRKVF